MPRKKKTVSVSEDQTKKLLTDFDAWSGEEVLSFGLPKIEGMNREDLEESSFLRMVSFSSVVQTYNLKLIEQIGQYVSGLAIQSGKIFIFDIEKIRPLFLNNVDYMKQVLRSFTKGIKQIGGYYALKGLTDETLNYLEEMPDLVIGSFSVYEALKQKEYSNAFVFDKEEDILNFPTDTWQSMLNKMMELGNAIKEAKIEESYWNNNEELAEQAIVLLKNEGQVLPLKGSEKIALIGHILPQIEEAEEPIEENIEELQSYFAECGANIIGHSFGYDIDETKAKELSKEATALAKTADIAIVFLYAMEETLPKTQLALITALAKNKKLKTIVVLSTAQPIELSFHSKCTAIIQANIIYSIEKKALANILNGIASPSGKLIWEYKYKGKGSEEISYPIGYGLGYAECEYSDLKIEENTIQFKIANKNDISQDHSFEIMVNEKKENIYMDKIHLNAFEEKEIQIPLTERNEIHKIWIGSSKEDIRLETEINLTEENPLEEPIEEIVEEPVKEPTEEKVEEPAEEPTEEKVEEPVEEPTEEKVEEPAEEPTEEKVEKPAEEPTEEKVEEPVEEIEPKVEVQTKKAYALQEFHLTDKTKKKTLFSSRAKIILAVLVALYFDVVLGFCIWLAKESIYFKESIYLIIFLGFIIFIVQVFAGIFIKLQVKKKKDEYIIHTNSYDKVIEQLKCDNYFEDVEVKPILSTESTEEESSSDEEYIESVEIASKSDFNQDISLQKLCEEFCSFSNARGVGVEYASARMLFSSFASTKMIFMHHNDKELLQKFLGILSEYLGIGYYKEKVQPSWVRMDDVLYRLYNGEHHNTAILNAISSAMKSPDNMTFAVIDGVNPYKMEYLKPILDYVKNATVHHTIKLRNAFHYELSELEEIPKNLWFIMILEDGLPFKVPFELSKNSVFLFPNIRVGNAVENPISNENLISYSRFKDCLHRQAEEKFISEELWKRIDQFEEFMQTKLNFKIGNKEFCQMEDYTGCYLICGGEPEEAIDTIMAVKILPMVASIYRFRTESDDSNTSDALDRIFGADNTMNSHRILTNLKANMD